MPCRRSVDKGLTGEMDLTILVMSIFVTGWNLIKKKYLLFVTSVTGSHRECYGGWGATGRDQGGQVPQDITLQGSYTLAT